MREKPIYPHKFGSGIPNPIGNARFRGVDDNARIETMPDNYGPLVSKKLQFGTEVALFSQDQWKDISIWKILPIIIS